MYLDGNKQKANRISISRVNKDKIEFWIRELAACIVDMMQKKKRHYNMA